MISSNQPTNQPTMACIRNAFEKKILIVDSHEGFRKTLKVFLKRQNLNLMILEADSETSAVQKALKEQPNLVLLELQLPKMDGIATSKLIRKVSPSSKIIIVSTFDTEKFPGKNLGKSIDDCIGKNEFVSNLLQLLRKHLKKIATPGPFASHHLR